MNKIKGTAALSKFMYNLSITQTKQSAHLEWDMGQMEQLYGCVEWNRQLRKTIENGSD